ncbi:MAG: DNA mismatch repair endonuclease MutL [Eubacteriales bacterium]|nr:DNA mismatch repair endonuclease MutL [Eubacteriales bacterium]
MLQQNSIIKLSKEVADKIAAGEVVDRPLSIVKELVENAIDAGANSLIVEIKNGGKTYIRVTDNGCGIAKADLLTAFERHATSKIRNASDLDAIETLGFRGEALASIAAVSAVEIITKTENETIGSRLLLRGSEAISQTDTGCPQGTTIIVSELFYNTPARMKFLKSDGAESSLIIDFLSKMAIAYSSLRFRVINNGAILFSTPGKGNVASSILTVYSKELNDPLLQVNAKEAGLSLEAYVSAPAYTRTTRKQQIYFVNGRYIKSKVLENAVDAAYKERLPEGRHPVIILFLSIDPRQLDVNIHPNKREVRFEDNAPIEAFIKEALKSGLSVKEAVPVIRDSSLRKSSDAYLSMQQSPVPLLFEEKEELSFSLDKHIFKMQELTSEHKDEEVDVNVLLSTKRNEQVSMLEPTVQMPFDFSKITIFGAIFGTYITASDADNFYLIDQHAAHERVFYERLLAASGRKEKASQLLLAPLLKETSVATVADSEQFMSALRQFGFELEVFGAKAFLIKAVPAFMQQGEADDFLEAFFDQTEDTPSFKDEKKLGRIIMDSCKSAVKGNQHLSLQEMQALLLDLSRTQNPFSCPHGRPTFIKLTKAEIEKLFKRV